MRILRCLMVGVLMAVLLPLASFANVSDYHWTVVYDGYGSVYRDEITGDLYLEPMTAMDPFETHSALVVSEEQLAQDYEVVFRMETIEQLRKNSDPNPWEMGWAVFGYKDVVNSLGEPDQSFSYIILKPNGLEFGEAMPDDGQNFLWTSPEGADSYVPGQTYELKVRVQGGVVTVWVDGVQKFSFADTSKRTLNADGKLGIYAEDAFVRLAQVQATSLVTSTPQKSKRGRRGGR